MSYVPVPELECDVVMKGGITSGVIYPGAVCVLARTYRLRSVGGSSAGAIAAAGAAAAEYGRATGGFEHLAQLPLDITESSTGKSVLFGLFQPTRTTRPLYRVFTASIAGGHRGWAVVRASLAGFWPWALGGGLLGLALLVASSFGTGVPRIAGMAAGALVALLGVVLGVVAGVLTTLARVPAAGFGLCTGMPGADAGGAAALTPWLHERFQQMAGLTDRDVLTFGMLADRQIELRTMTTNLTRRQPMAMPWANQEYFFEPDEMRSLFPADVVQWLIDNPPTRTVDGGELTPFEQRKRDFLRAQAGTKRPWPAPRDVPVLVATRMSLSFPLLITAVPLYAVNYSLPANKEARDVAAAWLAANPDRPVADGAAAAGVVPVFERNWFSDGGICANLPVHFFDSPLPTRPTFAIDLEAFPPHRPKSPVPEENCELPINNNAGLQRPWTSLRTTGVGALGAFLLQVVNTARGWVDAGQLVMPGYRDRVVTIFHDESEGGMNLAMPASVVTGLAERGAAAGALLVTKFTGRPIGEDGTVKAPGWGWNNQRWIRFRTATAGLRTWLGRFDAAYRAPVPPPTVAYSDLAGAHAQATLPSYDYGSVGERDSANAHVAALLAMASEWVADESLLSRAPRPRPHLRLVPDEGIGPLADDGAAGTQ